jgi:hypothetical protein
LTKKYGPDGWVQKEFNRGTTRVEERRHRPSGMITFTTTNPIRTTLRDDPTAEKGVRPDHRTCTTWGGSEGKMQEFVGQTALDELAQRWALHDGIVRQISVRRDPDVGVVFELSCLSRPESPVAEVVLRIEGVSRFDLGWEVEWTEFLFVPGYKATLLPCSTVYLSLDPYDDRVSEPDARDCSVVVGRHLRVRFRMRGDPEGETLAEVPAESPGRGS